MPKIAVLSDIHLSPTHGFFWRNFEIARDWANASGADAVIVNGDLCINGPESDDEMAFAAHALAGLRAPVFALPGNHDVGDEPPGQDAHQLITPERVERWLGRFAADRFAFEAGGWTLIGINAQLLGSSLPREAEQTAWLADTLGRAAHRPAALFLHKPLLLDDASDGEPSPACTPPAPRAALLRLLTASSVRLVVSGHLHQHRDRLSHGLRHLWLPATAFGAPRDLGGDPRCGVTLFDFGEGGVEVKVHYPEGLVTHDLAAIKGHGQYAFLRDMPPAPPEVRVAEDTDFMTPDRGPVRHSTRKQLSQVISIPGGSRAMTPSRTIQVASTSPPVLAWWMITRFSMSTIR
jgi:predicted phosphodiesterase